MRGDERIRTAVTAPSTDLAYEPPESIWIIWCPVCGRDDRYTPFTGRSHFSRDGRCKGTPVRVTYARAEADRGRERAC